MDICLRVLKASNKSRFDSYKVRNSILIISHITFRDSRAHMSSNNLSRNSCIYCAFQDDGITSSYRNLWLLINLIAQLLICPFCFTNILDYFSCHGLRLKG